MAMSKETENARIQWQGAGWYGPFQHQGYDGEYVMYYRVNTPAGKDDPIQAGNDAYWHEGTPEWLDTEAEFNG